MKFIMCASPKSLFFCNALATVAVVMVPGRGGRDDEAVDDPHSGLDRHGQEPTVHASDDAARNRPGRLHDGAVAQHADCIRRPPRSLGVGCARHEGGDQKSQEESGNKAADETEINVTENAHDTLEYVARRFEFRSHSALVRFFAMGCRGVIPTGSCWA